MPFYLYSFFNHLFPFYAVYTVLIHDALHSPFLLSTLLAVWSLTVVLLEVPSGALADYWSRRAVVCIGLSAKLLVCIIWFAAEHYPLFLLGFIFWGLQESFCSGAVDALLYEELEKQGREEQYEHIYSICYRLSTIAVPVAVFGGGVMYRIVPAAVFITSLCTAVAAFTIAWHFPERTAGGGGVEEIESYRAVLKNAFTQLGKSPFLIRLFIYSIFSVFLVGTVEEFLPVVFHSYRLSALLFGSCLALIMLAQTTGGFLSRKVRLGSETGLYGTGAVMCILTAVTVFFDGIAAVIPWVTIFILVGMLEIKVNALINNQCTGQRATVLSLHSLTGNLSAIILSLLVGIIARRVGLATSISICGVGAAAIPIILFFTVRCADHT